MTVESYNPRKLLEFAVSLTKANQNAVVVGHSNTTPMLSHNLGGVEAVYMPETEYDRLIKLEINHDKVDMTVLRIVTE